MRLGRIGCGKGTVNHRLDDTAGQQRPDFFLPGLGNRGLEFKRTWPQGRTSDGQPLAQHQSRVELGLDATLNRDDDQTAVFGEAFDFTRHITARHHIENNVNNLALGQLLDLPGKVMGLVIDRVVGTELFTALPAI